MHHEKRALGIQYSHIRYTESKKNREKQSIIYVTSLWEVLAEQDFVKLICGTKITK